MLLGKRKRRYLLYLKGFPGGLDGKESACNAGDQGFTPDPEDLLE